MDKVNTLLLLILIGMTGYQISNLSGTPAESRSGQTPGANEISRTQVVERKISGLAVQFADIQQRLTTIDSRIEDISTKGTSEKPLIETRPAENEAANIYVDNLLANGSVTQEELLSLNRHISRMDPHKQKEVLQKLVTAINEQKIDISPDIAQ